MTDCANVLMRDLLPEYAHGVLGADDTARVAAHLAACDACRAELALIGRVQDGLALGVRRVDVAAIVGALPAPLPAVPAVRAMPRRWVSRPVWQYAAAAGLVLVVGGGIVLRRAPDGASARVADSSYVGARLGTQASEAEPDVGITFGGGLSDLSLDDLQALLGQLDSVRTLPSTDPESMTPVIAINEGGMTQ